MKMIKNIMKIKKVITIMVNSFLAVYLGFAIMSFILVILKKVKIINIGWDLAFLPLVIAMLIFGAYFIMFLIDEVQYQKKIRR